MEFLVSIRFQGEERKFCRLKADKSGNFYALDLAEPLLLDRHYSYHTSGERHFITQGDTVRGSRIKCYVEKRQATTVLRQVEQLLKSGAGPSDFQTLPRMERSSCKIILLDADASGFRNEWFGINIYIMEEGKEGKLPVPPHVGPRILCIEHSTKPCLAFEAFQEKVRAKLSGVSIGYRQNLIVRDRTFDCNGTAGRNESQDSLASRDRRHSRPSVCSPAR